MQSDNRDEATAELVRAARAGSDEAVETLFRAFEQPLFRYLYRIVNNQQDAEDALQQTFIRAYRGLPAYREQGQFKAWIYRVAHREGLRTIRKRKRRREGEAPTALPEPADPRPVPGEALMAKDRLRRLEALIQALPEAEREVVHLRLGEEMTFREIAEVTGCPLGTALSRMKQATQRLREHVGELDG